MSDALKNFYESHYKKDEKNKELPIVHYTKTPTDRTQACIKYFVDNQISGDILEFGSGDGSLTNSLLNTNLNINKYLATDLSRPRLESIKNNINSDKLEIQELDIENFECENYGKFDAIIMLALIEHLIDPITAMKNIKKLLKPNGIIFIETPNVAELGYRFKLLRGRFPATASKNEGLTSYAGKPVSFFDNGHIHYFTYRSLTLMLKNFCGYSNVIKYHAPVGKLHLGKKIHTFLAKLNPEMFSSVFVIAKQK